MNTLNLMVAVAALSTAFCTGAQDSVRAVDTYNAASGMLARGLDDLAAAEYEKFLSEFEDHELADQARYGLGVASSRLSRHEETIEALEPLLGNDRFQYAVECSLLCARSMLALGEAEDAARVLQRTLRRHSDHALAVQASALCVEAFYRAGRYEQAVEIFEESEPSLSGGFAERARYFAGLSEYSRGELRNAVMRFGRLESGDTPVAASARLMLARTLQQLGDLESARSAYQNAKIMASGAQSVEVSLGLSQVLTDLDRFDEAQRELESISADEIAGDLKWRIDLERGRVLALRGESENASRLLGPVASRGPESIRDDASYWLARAEASQGRQGRASQLLTEAIETYPDSPLIAEMKYQLGLSLGAAGQHEEACRVLRRLAREHGDNSIAGEALLAAASFAQQSGDLALAEELSHEAAGELKGDNAVEAAFLAAESAYQRQDYRAAARAYEQIVSSVPQDHPRQAMARYRLGMSYKQLGNADMAARTLERLYEDRRVDERFLPGLLAIGDMRFAAEQWDDAASWLGRYVELGSDKPSWDAAALRLGLAYKAVGDRRSALAAFERLIQEAPRSEFAPRAWYETGLIAASLDETDRAAEAFERASRSGNSEIAGLAFQQLGSIADARGDHAQAAAYFEQASGLSEDGQGAVSQLNQARALLAAGSYRDATAVLSRLDNATLDQIQRAQVSALLTIAYARNDQHDEAVSAAQGLLRDRFGLDVLDAQAAASLLYECGRSYRTLDRDTDAERTLLQLVERYPESSLVPSARLECAAIAMKGERYDEAAEQCSLIMRQRDDLAVAIVEQATYRLGVCARALGDHDNAARVLEELALREPADSVSASAALIAGESFLETGNLGRAIEMLEVASETGDETVVPVAMLRLGEAQVGMQYWGRAEETYKRFLERYSSDSRAYMALFGHAWSLENQGQFDAAIEGYRSVIAQHDGETAARAQFQIGECLYAQRKYDDAVRELLRVDLVYTYPQWSAAALFEAGRCFEELERESDARAQYEQVIERFGEAQWAELAHRRLGRFQQTTTQQGG